MTTDYYDDEDSLPKLIGELKELVVAGFEVVNENYDRLEDRIDRLEARMDGRPGGRLAYEH